MAVETKKVLEILSTKFKGKSISKTFLTKAATRYAARIENDADIDDYINEREDDILAAGEEADRRVTSALKTPAPDPKKVPSATETEIDDEELEGAPSWAKALIKQNKELAEKVQGFESKQTVATIAERFTKDDRLKGLSPVLLKGRIPTSQLSDEDLETLIEETATELKPFMQTSQTPGGRNVRANIERPGSVQPLGGIVTATGDDDVKPSSGVSAFVANLNKQNNSQNLKS